MPSCDNSTPVLELTNLIEQDFSQQEQDKPVQSSVQPSGDGDQPECTAGQDQAGQPADTAPLDAPIDAPIDAPLDAPASGVLQGQAVICDKLSENTASESDMACYIEETINRVTMQMHECMRMEAAVKFKDMAERLDSFENLIEQKKAFDMRTQESLQACQNQLNLATTRLNSLNKEVQRLLAMSPENNEAESSAAESAEQQELTERVRAEVSRGCSDLESSLSKLKNEIIRLAATDSARKNRLDQLEVRLKEFSARQDALEKQMAGMEAEQSQGKAEGSTQQGIRSEDLDDLQGQIEENEIKTHDISLRLEALADTLDQCEQNDRLNAMHLSEMGERIARCEAVLSEDAMEQLAAKACARILREEIRLLKENGR